MVFQNMLNTGVEPVKCIPASRLSFKTMFPMSSPEPGRKLITPFGNPASINISMRRLFDRSEVDAGFHITTLPMIAGAVGRFPAIAVKLKGVVAKINSMRIQIVS